LIVLILTMLMVLF